MLPQVRRGEYNPHDWYWLRENGEVYSSFAHNLIDPKKDSRYLAWQARGNRPTMWPRNRKGEQTTHALQEVLGEHGLYVRHTAGADAAFAKFVCYLDEVSSGLWKLHTQAETLSWHEQLVEARIVTAGGHLPAPSLLKRLAAASKTTTKALAKDVLAQASMRHQTIADVVELRSAGREKLYAVEKPEDLPKALIELRALVDAWADKIKDSE